MRDAQLDRFLQDVIPQGAQALLPQHLSEEWLDALLEEAEIFTSAPAQEEREQSCPGLLAAVLMILDYQHGHPLETLGKLEVTVERLFTCLECYAACLAIEQVNRATTIHGEPPTLDTIFNPRRIITFTRQ